MPSPKDLTTLYDELWPEVMRDALKSTGAEYADDVMDLLTKLAENPKLASDMANPREKMRVAVAYVTARIAMSVLLATTRHPTLDDAKKLLADFLTNGVGGGCLVVVEHTPKGSPPTNPRAQNWRDD